MTDMLSKIKDAERETTNRKRALRDTTPTRDAPRTAEHEKLSGQGQRAFGTHGADGHDAEHSELECEAQDVEGVQPHAACVSVGDRTAVRRDRHEHDP